MAVKYVFVTGGVVSGLGKGITAASLGRLLKARGYQVTMQKFDPYINIDPGTMNPIQHGEVFVTDDGTETDLDLGHYERFIDESLDKNSNVTTGKIYWSVLQKERHGDFGGGTVQVIPHITNEIKSRFYRAKSADEDRIAIIEVGGTVGDIESQPFLESIRQFQHDVGHDNAILIHVTLIPYLRASGEMKTKPTQASVKELQGMGIQPDVLVCRSEYPLTEDIRGKIALFCNVPVSNVLQNLDVEYLYEAPLAMEREKLADVVLQSLRLENRKPDLTDWENMVENLRHPDKTVKIAMVGKYTQLHDAYLSVVEALKHGGISCRAKVDITWVDSEELNEKNLDQTLHSVDGILVPGGFGNRGTEGMILAAQYARVHKIPYLGICLGMQMAIVEFARHVLGYEDANSIELAPETTHPVIGNGDVVDGPSAKALLEETGCAAVAIGRAAWGNPWVFKEVNAYLENGDIIDPPSWEERLAMAREHLHGLVIEKGENAAVREMRAHASRYFHGLPEAAALRREIMKALTEKEFNETIDRYEEEKHLTEPSKI